MGSHDERISSSWALDLLRREKKPACKRGKTTETNRSESMTSINVREAKTNLSKLLQRVATGEEIVIFNRGVPVARLIPYSPARGRRKLGFEKGRARIAKNFDVPLPQEILAGFLVTPAKPKKR
jgi:prevent-host-death family protein